MFFDAEKAWPPPEPWQPPEQPPRLSPRGARVVGWMIGLNIVLLLVGPLAGATIFEGVAMMLGAGR